MAPRFLHPAEWLALLDGMPRIPAIVVLVAAASILVLGLRWFPWYVRLAGAVCGWTGGMMLARLMHVKGWYVALPLSLVAIGAVWAITRFVTPVLMGVVVGSLVGTLVANGLELANFWFGFAAGFFLGLTLAVVASRFATVLLCSICATLAIVATLGAAVRLKTGFLSPGGYVDYPVIYVIVGAVLFVVAMIAQVALEPDTPMPGSKER